MGLEERIKRARETHWPSQTVMSSSAASSCSSVALGALPAAAIYTDAGTSPLPSSLFDNPSNWMPVGRPSAGGWPDSGTRRATSVLIAAQFSASKALWLSFQKF